MLIRIDIKYKNAEFIGYLLKLINTRIHKEFAPRKVEALELYLNTESKFKDLSKFYISCSDVFFSVPDNLDVYINNRYIVIQIDKNVFYANTKIRFVDLIKFLTYGNLEIKGYPLLLDIFEDISENIETYFQRFKAGI